MTHVRELKSSRAPIPPSLHWLLLLLVCFFAFLCNFLKFVFAGGVTNIFLMIWILVQCRFIRKIDPKSNALWLSFLAIGSGYLAVGINSAFSEYSKVIDLLGGLVTAGLFTWAAFSARFSMLRYYNTVEPINLSLNAGMTFFFTFFYIQYHFWRIANWKKTGVLKPQTPTSAE